MLNGQLEDKISEYYRQEMLVKAEKARYANIVENSNGKGNNSEPLLARLGKVLSTVGDNLQERYGTLDEQAIQPQSKKQLPA